MIVIKLEILTMKMNFIKHLYCTKNLLLFFTNFELISSILYFWENIYLYAFNINGICLIPV